MSRPGFQLQQLPEGVRGGGEVLSAPLGGIRGPQGAQEGPGCGLYGAPWQVHARPRPRGPEGDPVQPRQACACPCGGRAPLDGWTDD